MNQGPISPPTALLSFVVKDKGILVMTNFCQLSSKCQAKKSNVTITKVPVLLTTKVSLVLIGKQNEAKNESFMENGLEVHNQTQDKQNVMLFSYIFYL